MNVNAGTIHTTAALDEVKNTSVETEVGVSVTGKLHQSGVIVSAEGKVNNKKTDSIKQDATVAELSASQNVELNGETISHQGSQIIAGDSVKQRAENIEQSSAVAENATNTSSLTIALTDTNSVDTAKIVNVNLTLKGEGKNQQSSQENAQSTRIEAGHNIELNAVNVDDKGTKYQAGNNLSVKAETYNLGAMKIASKESSLEASARLGLNANSKDMNTIYAKVSVGGKFQTQTSTEEKAHSSEINATNIDIQVGTLHSNANIKAKENVHINATKVNLQGTNINAETLGIQAHNGSVKVVDVLNTDNRLSVSAGAGVNVGASVSNLGLKANVGVGVENSTTHNAVALNAGVVDINATENISISGSSSQSEKLNLNAKEIALIASQDNVSKTNVKFGASLKGGMENQLWNPNVGGANAEINVVRNQLGKGEKWTSQEANIDANNLSLIGTSMTTTVLTGAVNSLHRQVLVNKRNEFSLSAKADGGGKFSTYLSDKWKDQVLNDWTNGTLANAKGNVTFAISHQAETSNVEAELEGGNKGFVVNSEIKTGGAEPSKTNFDTSFDLSSNLQEMPKRLKKE
ncbi:hypothetical protein GVX81_08625 [[Haemophilus] felis]|uniref:Uncharacterized protein n=1 Tax=[Haemophilus] felis TaxID=123822 RepID=A0A1T0AUR9_9PAST|nr:hypothetical protein [[Haemophilus] felis]NBI41347.1 hypothetical protein [[Haemophilus] felis]OOS00211.1 hypothetical protein B0188_10860 [[Haemophilus] felis]